MTKVKIPTPIGVLTAEVGEGLVYALHLDESSEEITAPQDTGTVEQLRRELDEYFRGERRIFSLEACPAGTAFQQSVWREMRAIPYGEVRTYGELAAAVGKPGAARAVGQACNKNPVLLLIPCHRVVASGGIGGFAYGTDCKRILLDLEGVVG